MILPDLNLLLCAYNPHTPFHEKAQQWWKSACNSDELIGLPHEVLFGFIRIATNPGLGAAAVPLADAEHVVSGWLELPNSRLILPGADHFSEVIRLMKDTNSIGRVLSDAVLAAHAIANRATLCSNDADFARFEQAGLKWVNPLA